MIDTGNTAVKILISKNIFLNYKVALILLIIIFFNNYRVLICDEKVSIQEIIKKFPRNINEIKDARDLQNLKTSYLNDIKDQTNMTKINISIDMLKLLYPLYQDSKDDKFQMRLIIEEVLSVLRNMNKEKLLEQSTKDDIARIIGDYNYKSFLKYSLNIRAFEPVDPNPPFGRIKNMILDPVEYEVKDLATVSGDIEIYLTAKENKVTDKIEICILALDLYSKTQDIMKNLEDKSQYGWYGITSKSLREEVIAKIIELKSNKDNFEVLKKYKEQFNKKLTDLEIKNIFDLVAEKDQ